MKLIVNDKYFGLFPRLNKVDMDKLVKSIEINGQFIPIAANSEGIILDGYSRLEACKRIGIEPHYNVFTFQSKEEELNFVVASNLTRRHLNDVQKYELAKKLLPMEREFARIRQHEGQMKGAHVLDGEKSSISPYSSISIEIEESGLLGTGTVPNKIEIKDSGETSLHAVGRELGISETKLHRIQKIDEAGRTDLLNQIEKGQLTVYGAYGKVLPKTFLKDDFIVPPFSIIDLKTKEAQSVKAEYHNRFDSGLGRDQEGLNQTGIVGSMVRGISVFHPLICKFGYTNYTKEGDIILDPFCGGSVRGIMAGELGRGYVGFDLRQEQIDENEKQAGTVEWGNGKIKPKWICSDTIDMDRHLLGDFKADLIFTSPPYSMGLEHYSDKPEDLNNLSLEGFRDKYAEIIRKALKYLKHDGYSIWIVSDVRDKDGFYWGLDSHTTKIHEEMGWGLWNTIIELDPLGNAPQRARKLFDASKKVVRVHQVVLIFKHRV